MIICTKCLTRNGDGVEFCSNAACGAYLPFWGKQEAVPEATSGAEPAPVAVEGSVKVVVDGAEPVRATPGGEAVCEVRVCNTGADADEFLLQVFGEPSQWSVTEPARVTLDAGGEAVVTARLHPPASVAAQRRIAFGIGATSTRDPSVFVVKERVLELAPGIAATPVPTPGVTISVAPADVVCDAGGSAAVQVRVRNAGTVLDSIAVEVMGTAREWSTAEPAVLPLAPGQEATSAITFHPPRGPDPPAGAIPTVIKATSGANATVSAEQPVQVAVRPFRELHLVLRPERAEGSRPTPFELWIENGGNTALEGVSVEGTDKDQQVEIAALPAELAVPRGEWARSLVTVAPRKRIFVGRAKPRPFELLVGARDEAKRTVGGTLVQKALVPWWLLAIIGALAVVVALIVRALSDESDLSGIVVALLAAAGLVIGLALAGLAMVTGSLGRLFKPGPDPMGIGATFLVGLGGVVAAVVLAFAGAALFGNAGALIAIPGALITAVLLVGAFGRNRPEVPPPPSRPPARV